MQEPSDATFSNALCNQVMPKLPGVVDGAVVLTAAEQAHVATCLQCQAELVRYRRLLRALHDLRTHMVRPAPGLLSDILDNLGEKAERRAIMSIVTGKRAAYAGGITAAAVVGVTGAILLSGRVRKAKKAA